MINWLKENLILVKGNSLLVIGTGLVAYNLLSFKVDRFCDHEGGLNIEFFAECYNPEAYYYFSHDTVVLLTLGVIFVIIGLLKIRN